MPTSVVIKVLIEEFRWTMNKLKSFEKWQIGCQVLWESNQPTVLCEKQCDVFQLLNEGVRRLEANYMREENAYQSISSPARYNSMIDSAIGCHWNLSRN